MEESITKHNSLSQNNANVITLARRLLTRILLPAPCCCHSAPTNKVRDHHRYQPHDTKLQGWVHYKENQYQIQITTISKKHTQHYELTQHSLFNIHIQQLLIIHPWIQSMLHRMMHAPDLNSQMQCGTYCIQYQGNSLSVSTRHLT